MNKNRIKMFCSFKFTALNDKNEDFTEGYKYKYWYSDFIDDEEGIAQFFFTKFGYIVKSTIAMQ